MALCSLFSLFQDRRLVTESGNASELAALYIIEQE